MFDEFDTDHSGSIDAAELMVSSALHSTVYTPLSRRSLRFGFRVWNKAVMERFGMHPTADELQQMIADVDTEGTGTVSFEEFVAMVKQTAAGGEDGGSGGAQSFGQIVERVREYKEALDIRDFDALERMTTSDYLDALEQMAAD